MVFVSLLTPFTTRFEIWHWHSLDMVVVVSTAEEKRLSNHLLVLLWRVPSTEEWLRWLIEVECTCGLTHLIWLQSHFVHWIGVSSRLNLEINTEIADIPSSDWKWPVVFRCILRWLLVCQCVLSILLADQRHLLPSWLGSSHGVSLVNSLQRAESKLFHCLLFAELSLPFGVDLLLLCPFVKH